MNILVLGASSDLYGGSKILSIVANILAEGKHNPIVVISETGPLVEELAKHNVEVKIIRLGILRRKYMSISGILNRITVTRSAWKALNSLIDDRKIDLIYSNTTGVFIGAFLAKKRKLKHIWHIHEIITKPKIFTKVMAYLLERYSDKIIVVSDAVKIHWEKYLKTKSITKIYNGIDTSIYGQDKGFLRQELGLAETDLVIGMIGRVNQWKGQDYFIDIAKIILQVRPEIKFVIAGDAFPGNEHFVERMVNRLKSEVSPGAIHYIGYRTDIPNILNSIDIFVLPSILPDPFPTVILEAMASSKPVIATNHGGATEMISNEESGLLIPFDDVNQSAKKILTIIGDKDRILGMGKVARHRIDTLFSLENFKRAILEIFKQTNH